MIMEGAGSRGNLPDYTHDHNLSNLVIMGYPADIHRVISCLSLIIVQIRPGLGHTPHIHRDGGRGRRKDEIVMMDR